MCSDAHHAIKRRWKKPSLHDATPIKTYSGELRNSVGSQSIREKGWRQVRLNMLMPKTCSWLDELSVAMDRQACHPDVLWYGQGLMLLQVST